MFDSEKFNAIALTCQQSRVGKLLPNALYVHVCALNALDPKLQNYEQLARQQSISESEGATLVKFTLDRPQISYLFYPDFDTDPHPALHASIQVDLNRSQVNSRNYTDVDNPPILHRKETFVTPEYPLYERFAELTRQEEELGLLNNPRFIGTNREWQKRLVAHSVVIENHCLVCPREPASRPSIAIERHKAAIIRHSLSRPVRTALEADLFTPDTTFFDYGCGHGGDIQRIAEQNYISSGWDPYYRPDIPLTEADIVNLGYVINVIEDLAERREALIKAWELTRKVLIVAAQVLIDNQRRGIIAYGDGIITQRNTFQKYYQQEELKIYIDQVLEVDAIPGELGIYFVFRDQAEAQKFRASRFTSRVTTPKVQTPPKNFEDYRELLSPLMAFVTQRGRLPVPNEFPQEKEILAEFKSLRRAFQVILTATEEKEWEAIAQKRRDDLQVYLALSRFGHRPKLKDFAPMVREDLKGLFGSYKKACTLADEMLFEVGNLEAIALCCQESSVGKKLSNGLLVHIDALATLHPLLRLYEGCASRAIGRLDTVTLVKFHTRKPKISYLYYPNFDRDPHPVLQSSMKIDLQDLRVSYWEPDDENPPILHRKEDFVSPDYPLYDKFMRLTHQEEAWGLLENMATISHLQGWLQCLEDHCATLKSHRLYWRKDADPYKLKLLQSRIRNRKREKLF